MTATRRGGGYQTWLVLLLSLNFGILFFDRQAANFMMPQIQPDLGLSNFQVGMIASGLSLTWALAALTVGPLSDRLGSRKPILLACTLMFCACSMLSGLAGGFLALLAARLLMGAAEGGVMPISHARSRLWSFLKNRNGTSAMKTYTQLNSSTMPMPSGSSLPANDRERTATRAPPDD